MNDEKRPEKKPGIVALIGSVMAAGIGVQSSRNHERDFTQGKARNFIIAGVLFTALFVLTVYLVVSAVLEKSAH